MKARLWQLIAAIVSRPAVADWLIRRAAATPYRHLMDPDGSVYMRRFWLFNAYPDEREGTAAPKGYWSWFPSVRLHQIMREDRDQHLHDHPWDARTVILRGWYQEQRLLSATDTGRWSCKDMVNGQFVARFFRSEGQTVRLVPGMFHSITQVPLGGVWTLFITWKRVDTWGFLVDGKRVPYREYLNLPPKEPK